MIKNNSNKTYLYIYSSKYVIKIYWKYAEKLLIFLVLNVNFNWKPQKQKRKHKQTFCKTQFRF